MSRHRHRYADLPEVDYYNMQIISHMWEGFWKACWEVYYAHLLIRRPITIPCMTDDLHIAIIKLGQNCISVTNILTYA